MLRLLFASSLKHSNLFHPHSPLLSISRSIQSNMSEGSKFSPPGAIVKFQIISPDLRSDNTSLTLSAGSSLFIFDCGANLQKCLHAAQARQGWLKEIMILDRSWDKVSGVLGATLAIGVKDGPTTPIRVRGFPSLQELYDISSHYVHLRPSVTFCPDDSREYEDPYVNIKRVPFQSSDFATRFDNNGENSSTKKRVKLATFSGLSAYICSFPPVQGPLDPTKCKKLGVPIGPLLAKLKSGKNVTLADGRVVRPSEVCGGQQPGEKVIVMGCRNEDDIDSLSENVEMQTVKKIRGDGEVSLVFHSTPTHLIENLRYRRWMEEFPENCRHIFIKNPDPSVPNSVEIYRFQYLLNQLDSDIFPTLSLTPSSRKKVEDELQQPSRTGAEKVIDWKHYAERLKLPSAGLSISKIDRITVADSLDTFTLRPTKTMEPACKTAALDVKLKIVQMNVSFEDELMALRKIQRSFPKPKDHEPEVVFLGTSSGGPAKYRDSSCILVNFTTPKNLSIMLDCGEGSYTQLEYFYGADRVDDVLKQLKLIYISHHHCDHHLGLVELIEQRAKLTDDPVLLVMPADLEKVFEFRNKHFEPDLSSAYKIYDTGELKLRESQEELRGARYQRVKTDLKNALGEIFEDISIVPVPHCMGSCGVAMRFNIGHPDMKTFKIVYSGDTRPCEDLVVIGSGCDLLIHEATCSPDMLQEAISKRHCTSTEAIMVGRNMNAKYTILTHFSQKIAKIPYFTPKYDDKVGFAFDNLAIRCPSHYPRLPALKNILNCMYADERLRVETAKKRKDLVRDLVGR